MHSAQGLRQKSNDWPAKQLHPCFLKESCLAGCLAPIKTSQPPCTQQRLCPSRLHRCRPAARPHALLGGTDRRWPACVHGMKRQLELRRDSTRYYVFVCVYATEHTCKKLSCVLGCGELQYVCSINCACNHQPSKQVSKRQESCQNLLMYRSIRSLHSSVCVAHAWVRLLSRTHPVLANSGEQILICWVTIIELETENRASMVL